MDGILLQNVSVKIRGAQILKSVNAHFAKSQITGIIGNNGSGKSMLLKSICGFVRPSQGNILIDGIDYHKRGLFPPSIGFIIEGPGFLGELSAAENLLRLAAIRGMITEEDIVTILQQVDLDPLDKKPVRKFSMGMRQRLGIAQAIMESPNILILDEPMNGLDSHGVAEMRNLFTKLRTDNRVILLTSHNSNDIEMLCDIVYLMESGVLTENVLD